MSDAAKSCALLMLALAACTEAQRETTNNAAAADVEQLPPDESIATPTDELANGTADPATADNVQD